jgi:two-component system response regulator YesN
MHRIFLTCDDVTFCEKLRHCFHAETDFVVCGEARNGIELLKKALALGPNLVVMEAARTSVDAFEIAEALKIIMPEVPLFLITDQHHVQAEKDVLSRGIDAVFEKAHDLTALVMNARAICDQSRS